MQSNFFDSNSESPTAVRVITFNTLQVRHLKNQIWMGVLHFFEVHVAPCIKGTLTAVSIVVPPKK